MDSSGSSADAVDGQLAPSEVEAMSIHALEKHNWAGRCLSRYHEEADPVFALFFEANGLAAAGRQPYRALVPQLVEAWISWAAAFFHGTALQRRTEAETAIALLDGLLLVRQLAGPEAADRAASRVGVTGDPADRLRDRPLES